MTRFPFMLLGLVGFSSLLSVGCTNCTEIGCDSSVVLNFNANLPAGEYRLEVVGTPQAIACTFTIDSEGREALDEDCVIDGNDDSRGFRVNRAGIEIYDQPESLDVTVASEDPRVEVTVTEHYELTYETTYPNGKQCGPECINAAEQTLDISNFVAAIEALEPTGQGGQGGHGGAG